MISHRQSEASPIKAGIMIAGNIVLANFGYINQAKLFVIYEMEHIISKMPKIFEMKPDLKIKYPRKIQ